MIDIRERRPMDVETLAKELRADYHGRHPIAPWSRVDPLYQSYWLAVARKAIELLTPSGEVARP